MNKTVCTKL